MMTLDLHSRKLEELLARARRMIRLLPHMDSGVSTTPLELALQSLIEQQEILNVVQVGANDGKYNDPIYNFMITNKDRTRILLIEPQKQLIPILQQNYENHPQSTVANYAVGSDEEFTLFGVDPSAWKDCQVPYAKEWPKYRAATGIASGNRVHVESWLEEHYEGTEPISSLITESIVRAMPLRDLLVVSEFGSSVDVLQIDVEGFDDQVLYASSIEALKPIIINFENHLLSSDRYSRVLSYLHDLDYSTEEHGRDTLAIKVNEAKQKLPSAKSQL